jgi:hypothetical protein
MMYYVISLLVLIILIIYLFIYIRYNLTYVTPPQITTKSTINCDLGFVKSQDQLNHDYIYPDIDYGVKNYYKIFD